MALNSAASVHLSATAVPEAAATPSQLSPSAATEVFVFLWPALLLATAIVLLIGRWRHIELPPGVFICLAGGDALLATIWPPDNGLGRFFCLLIGLLFIAAEIRSIYRERARLDLQVLEGNALRDKHFDHTVSALTEIQRYASMQAEANSRIWAGVSVLEKGARGVLIRKIWQSVSDLSTLINPYYYWALANEQEKAPDKPLLKDVIETYYENCLPVILELVVEARDHYGADTSAVEATYQRANDPNIIVDEIGLLLQHLGHLAKTLEAAT